VCQFIGTIWWLADFPTLTRLSGHIFPSLPPELCRPYIVPSPSVDCVCMKQRSEGITNKDDRTGINCQDHQGPSGVPGLIELDSCFTLALEYCSLQQSTEAGPKWDYSVQDRTHYMKGCREHPRTPRSLECHYTTRWEFFGGTRGTEL